MEVPPAQRLRQSPPEIGLPEYYRGYVARVPAGDVLATLADQRETTAQELATIPGALETHRHREDAWSIRELVGHLVDTERVFQYRAVSMAREDPAPLPPMDHERWVVTSRAHDRSLASLATEFAAVRESSLHLFHSLDDRGWEAMGTANHLPFAVAAIPWILAGHERHHMDVLLTRYLRRDSPNP